MAESNRPGNAWVDTGENYFRTKIIGKSPDITGLYASTIDRLDAMFIYAHRNRKQIEKRAEQLDGAIANFNRHHRNGDFDNTHINARKLSRLMGKDKHLPLVKDNAPSPENNRFIGMFHSEIARGTYKFIDAIPESPRLMQHLITASLIDGYGLAVIQDHFKDKAALAPGMQKLSDLIVNTICEESNPGKLQKEIWETGWFNPVYGFSKSLSKRMDRAYR